MGSNASILKHEQVILTDKSNFQILLWWKELNQKYCYISSLCNNDNRILRLNLKLKSTINDFFLLGRLLDMIISRVASLQDR